MLMAFFLNKKYVLNFIYRIYITIQTKEIWYLIN